jgi:hypothetical protein
MACPRRSNCPLFGLFTMKAAALLWKANYCDADHRTCERLRRQQAGEAVPFNLLPNGRLMAIASAEELSGIRA